MNSRIEKNKKERKKIEKKESKILLKKILKLLLRIGYILLFLYVLIRYIGTTGIVVREYSKNYDTLPNSFNGFKVVQISDIYYGSSIKYNELKKVVDKINNIKPDLVVFTGGLIYKNYLLNDTNSEKIIELLSSIETTSGKYFITGTNEVDGTIQILNKSGFVYLDNKSEHIYYKSNEYIVLNGIINKQDFIVELDHFNITLIHEIDNMDLSNKTSEIIMAGNSLNGQFRVPFLKGLLKFKGSKKYYESYYEVNNSDLYISGGLGEHNLPFRLFNHPSINFYRLKTKSN